MSMAMAVAAAKNREKNKTIDAPTRQLLKGTSPGVQASGPFAKQIMSAGMKAAGIGAFPGIKAAGFGVRK